MAIAAAANPIAILRTIMMLTHLLPMSTPAFANQTVDMDWVQYVLPDFGNPAHCQALQLPGTWALNPTLL
jgi:hypothetical protein